MLRSVYFQKFTQNNLNLNCLSMLFVFKISDYFDDCPYLKRFNKTGWLSLLLLVPIIQLLFTLYVLLAPGTPYRNDYGDIRPSTTWEKLFAWIMIILSLMMIFGMFIFSYYFTHHYGGLFLSLKPQLEEIRDHPPFITMKFF